MEIKPKEKRAGRGSAAARAVSAALLVLLAGGCAWPGIDNQRKPRRTYDDSLESPMPGTQGKVALPAALQGLSANRKAPIAAPLVTVIPRGWQGVVTVVWSNGPATPPEGAAFLKTGLEASTNLLTWLEVARTNYAPVCVVTLSNRPPAREFYRAYAEGSGIWGR